MRIALRCDGGARTGAGHVARCLQIALAFRAAGDEPLFVGAYEGVAARLLSDAGMPVAAPVEGTPAGLEEGLAALVDSYDIPPAEVAAAGRRSTVAVVSDVGDPPPGVPALDYHPDARGPAIAGAGYVPVDPRLVAARRPRGFSRALVTVGGGEARTPLRERAAAALRTAGLRVEVPLASPGLLAEIGRADVAVGAAGVTAYELACAGLPAAIVAVAPNQARVARAMAAAGLALGVEGDGPALGGENDGLALGVEDNGLAPRAADDGLARAIASLSDAGVRERLARAGPAAIDGYGAFRARDALRATFEGSALPRALRYRPATAQDSATQLRWRNDPTARAASFATDTIAEDEHGRWFHAVLADPDRTLLVIEDGAAAAGSVRFDRSGGVAQISVVVDGERRGQGIGTQAVREASELLLAAHPALRQVRAEVRRHNDASLAVFRRAGFSPARDSPADRRLLTLDRAALASRPR